MVLFIDRLPMRVHRPNGLPEWIEVHLPILMTAGGASVPNRRTRPFRWRFDSACSWDAFAWTSHLIEAGLPPTGVNVGNVVVTTAVGHQHVCQIRGVDLWLFSNVPDLLGTPMQSTPNPGIVHFPSPRPSRDNRYPLIGPSLLRRAGVRMQLDFQSDALSLWIPSSPWRSLAHAARRLISIGRTSAISWAND